jgi:hypothetical protein
MLYGKRPEPCDDVKSPHDQISQPIVVGDDGIEKQQGVQGAVLKKAGSVTDDTHAASDVTALATLAASTPSNRMHDAGGMVKVKAGHSGNTGDQSDLDLQLFKKVGHGGFGVVWEGKWKSMAVAVKVLIFINYCNEDSEDDTASGRVTALARIVRIVFDKNLTLCSHLC